MGLPRGEPAESGVRNLFVVAVDNAEPTVREDLSGTLFGKVIRVRLGHRPARPRSDRSRAA